MLPVLKCGELRPFPQLSQCRFRPSYADTAKPSLGLISSGEVDAALFPDSSFIDAYSDYGALIAAVAKAMPKILVLQNKSADKEELGIDNIERLTKEAEAPISRHTRIHRLRLMGST